MLGCSPETGPDRASATTVVDSAGVRIVTSHSPQWTDETAWRVSATPEVSIGVLDGAPAEQLFRVSDAAILADGRVLVGNSGTSELRIFDQTGRHVASMGGDGEGPGEFRMMAELDVTAGDSIFVWDQRVRRVSVFSASGGFERSFQLSPPAEAAFPAFRSRFEDGSLLVQVPTLVGDEDLVDEAVRRNAGVYMRYAADGSPLDTIGTFMGSRSMLKFHEDGGSLSVLRVPFDAVSRVTTAAAGVLEGDGATFEIRGRDPSGALDWIIRREPERTPVTSELMTAHLEENYAQFSDQVDYYSGLRDAYAAMPVEGQVAAFDRIVVAADGTIWVRSHPLPGATAHVWSVFAEEGAWLGDVEMPAALDVFEIGREFVVGKQLDDLEVEHVVLYRILRP
ncbi:MAG: 6-bladed beta-propeller [Gemmatimonadota bacterium]|nr:6-bladed beta-propeller [Gemmatimonadota bacterium]